MPVVDLSLKRWEGIGDDCSEDEGPSEWPRPPGSDEAFAAAAAKKAGVAQPAYGRGPALEYTTTRAATNDDASQAVANLIVDELMDHPDLVLCAAAGATPCGTYGHLAAHFRNHPLLFSRLRVVQLDEWCGLPGDHFSSCQAYLRRNLVRPLEISEDRFLCINGDAANLETERRRVADALEKWGGVELALLGLGLNGHVGFNEPAAAEDEPSGHFVPSEASLRGVHVRALSAASQAHGMVANAIDLPPGSCTSGITLGLRDLLAARVVVLLVLGQHKAAALHEAMTLPVSALRPASVVLRRRQLWVAGHAASASAGGVHLVVDDAALPQTAAEKQTAKRERRAAARADAAIADGRMVRISGLGGRPELNGTYGHVKRGPHGTVHRYAVELEESRECVLLKRANLEEAVHEAEHFPEPLQPQPSDAQSMAQSMAQRQSAAPRETYPAD